MSAKVAWAVVVTILLSPAFESLSCNTFASDAGDDDAQRLVGKWRGGWPDEKESSYEIIITADGMSGKNLRDGTSLGEGTFHVDAAKRTIDAKRTDIKGKGTVYLGIYTLDGDTLRWCSNNGTRKRPAEQVHKPSEDCFLLILRRQK